MGTPYVGEIRMFAGNFTINGWKMCDGQELPISENETLFQIIGTTYGGDGEETFALPNLQARLPLHEGTNNQVGEAAGTESVTLTTQQIPLHNHTFIATESGATQPTPGGNLPAQSSSVQLFTEDTPAAALAPQALTPTGGSQPHENMHPFLVINFQISLFGTVPSQT